VKIVPPLAHTLFAAARAAANAPPPQHGSPSDTSST
jgi:hypothetical protein